MSQYRITTSLTVKSFADVAISRYRRASDTRGEVESLADVLVEVRNPSAEAAVKRYREMVARGDPKAKAIKADFPCATFSGVFGARNIAGLRVHSGLVTLDLDHLPNARATRDCLSLESCVLAAWVSVSGTGVKALIAVDKTADHYAAFATVERWAVEAVGATADASGKDVSRLCFLSYDAGVYVADDMACNPLVVAPLAALTVDGPEPDVDALMQSMANVLLDVDLVEAERVLAFVDPDCPREQWLNIGLALHTQFHHSDEAGDLFDRWSSGDLGFEGTPATYPGTAGVLAEWTTFRDPKIYGGRAATFRSVLARAYEGGLPKLSPIATAAPPEMRRDDAALLRDLSARIVEADLVELTGAVAEEIAKTDMFTTTRSALGEAIQERYRLITGGKKITKRELEAAIKFKAFDFFTREGAPEWSTGWSHVLDGRGGFWYNRKTGARTGQGGFNTHFAYDCISPFQRAQGIVTPSILPHDLLTGGDLVPRVHGIRYMPGMPDVFEDPAEPGMSFVNSYKADHVPVALPQSEWDDGDLAAVEHWVAHSRWLLGEDPAHMLDQYLGYLVRHPGKRLGWCYLIQGPEGIGKSFIGAIGRLILGTANVKIVNSATLSHRTFNQWAEGAELTLIEELYVDGASKWDIMNVLKPVITNDHIEIHPKGDKPYVIHNTASYIAFTNHPDPVPLAAGDRRYYVVETVIREREGRHGFLAALGGEEAAEAYYVQLFGAVAGRGAALRDYFERVDLSGFAPGDAKHTAAKADIVESSKGDEEKAVEAVIASGAHPTVDRDLVELEVLKGAVEFTVAISGQRLGRILRRMGYRALCPDPIDPPEGGGRKSRWFVHGRHVAQCEKDGPFRTIARLSI